MSPVANEDQDRSGIGKGVAIAIGVALIGTVAYTVLQAKGGVRRADLIDAGVLDESCVIAHLECAVRNLCRALPDGGQARRYQTIEAAGYVCGVDAGQARIVLPARRNDAGPSCLELVGDDACRLVTQGTCDDGELCDEENEGRVRNAPDRCWCRQHDAGMCRWRGLLDGGWAAIGRGVGGSNVHPGPVQGPGCVRSPCVAVAGDQDEVSPEVCR